jgi:hypothetical protein
LTRQRWRLLQNVIRTLEPFMAGLGLLWMALLIVDITRGLTPALRGEMAALRRTIEAQQGTSPRTRPEDGSPG